jgi:hypothetical protein
MMVKVLATSYFYYQFSKTYIGLSDQDNYFAQYSHNPGLGTRQYMHIIRYSIILGCKCLPVKTLVFPKHW